MPGEKTLGFSVKANFKFPSGKKLVLTTQITSVKLMFANNMLIPMLELTFYVVPWFLNEFTKPHMVDLEIKEKDQNDKIKTVIEGTFLIASNCGGMMDSDEGKPKRADFQKITQKYFLANAYSFMNQVVGCLKDKTKIKNVIEDLWVQTEHGTLQLDWGKLKNIDTYSQYFVPSSSFIDSLRCITQYEGLFDTLPIIYTDMKKLHIKSINDIKDPPIHIYLRQSSTQHKIKADTLKYGVYSLPSCYTNFNSIAATLPKDMNLVQHNKDELFTTDKINVETESRSMNIVDNTDMHDFFGKYIDQSKQRHIVTNPNQFSFRENLSHIMSSTIETSPLHVPDGFRFPHWFIGRKIIIEPLHLMYTTMNISLYVKKLMFHIKQEIEHRWDGTIDVYLSTVSTKNFVV